MWVRGYKLLQQAASINVHDILKPSKQLLKKQVVYNQTNTASHGM